MILTADYVVTGDGETIIENGAILLSGKKISKVGALEELKKENPEEEVKCYEGMTLMPGLIDLHVHISYTWGTPLEYDYERYPMLKAMFAVKRMEDTLRNGVTTIRDVASADNIGTALDKGGKYGFVRVPRIFTSGKGIVMTGGHGWSLKGGVVECDGEWEVRKAVRQNVRDGANVIKILTSEGYRGLEMSQEEINAACDEAHRLGVKVASHAGYDPSIQMSLDGGVDTIEHGTNLTAEQAKFMKEHDRTWVPTVYVFNYTYDLIANMNSDEEYLKKNIEYLKAATVCYQEKIKPFFDMGLRIACGTDTDCADYPEASPVYKECEYLVKCGLTPIQAIMCATKNGAEALGTADKFGQIKEDLLGDIIAVKGKPFENIEDLHNVEAVYLEGKEVSLY